MRVCTAPTIAAILLAAGLTAHGNPSVEPLCRRHIDRAGKLVTAWASRAAGSLRALGPREPEEPMPGPACAVLLGADVVAGLDSRGYVTNRSSSSAGDFAAITGSTAGSDSVGQRLTDPGVQLGLAVVMAFERSGDLKDVVSEVNVSDLDNPRVILCGGVVVEIGSGDYSMKIRRLRQILLRAPELGIRPCRVDMRFGRQVVVEYEAIETKAHKEV
jgi:hypothetical protein